MCTQESEAEVGVDNGPGALDGGDTAEDDDAHGQEDDGDDGAHHSQGVEVGAVVVVIDVANVHEHCKVGEMFTPTRGALLARVHNSTSGSVPATCPRVPEDTLHLTQR